MGGERGGHCPGFGGEVKRQRARSGVSQMALAERIDIGHGTLSRLEDGSRRPSLPMAVRIAAALTTDESERCKLVLAAGFVPPGYEVTGLRRRKST